MHLADVGNDDIEFVRLGAISLQMLPSFRRCKRALHNSIYNQPTI